jgi:hypothetical protein
MCFFMALSVLNTSIDVPDYILYGHGYAKKLADFNEMESIAELVVEKCLAIKDAFPEQRNDDSNGFGTVKKMADWIVPVLRLPKTDTKTVFFAEKKPFFIPEIRCVSQHISDTDTLPPNA